MQGAEHLTVTAWAKKVNSSFYETIFSQWTYATQGCFAFEMPNSTTLRVFIANPLTDAGFNNATASTPADMAGGYNKLSFVYNGSGAQNSDRLRLYFNGAALTATYGGTIAPQLQSATANLKAGRFDGLGRYYTGFLDHTTLSAVARSAAWEHREYLNQSAFSINGSFGTIELVEKRSGLFPVLFNFNRILQAV